MEVFVRNVPDFATDKWVYEFFKPVFTPYGITTFVGTRLQNKPLATITVLNVKACKAWLIDYGVPPNSPPHVNAAKRLHIAGKFLKCSASRNRPTDVALQYLAYQATQHPAESNDSRNSTWRKGTTRFDTTELMCGVWDYARDSGSELTFVPHFTDNRQGSVIFGRKQAIILLGTPGSEECRIDLNYHDCIDIVIGGFEAPSLTFNLQFAPRVFDVSASNYLVNNLANLGLTSSGAQKAKKVRITAINKPARAHVTPEPALVNPAHAQVASTCFVYRVVLADHRSLQDIRQVLERSRRTCEIFSWKSKTTHPKESHEKTMTRLAYDLDPGPFGHLPFSLRYQAWRLARNGILSPKRVLDLLPKIAQIHRAHGLESTVNALRRVARDRVLPGPREEARDFSIDSLKELLEGYAAAYNSHAPGNPYELARRHTHIVMVHRVVVTPVGTYLEGPEPEPANRVLRRYNKLDHFLRVVFQDEDGNAVRYDSRTDQNSIYQGRFKEVLDKGISICGRGFSFLGFSHSSLRTQSCWFMAPLVNEQQRFLFAEQVIRELGEFSSIRVPAKCAARIGQNFTDTNATIDLSSHQVIEVSNVVRNDRDFSDGCGTISQGLLEDVWKTYGTKKMLKPTALQIRFLGSKGMVSLDSRLSGKCLKLRPNMKKYESSAQGNLEICGAAFRPLPMVLNRQFIKLFEDLGIPTEVFMALQKTAMDRLRQMTVSSINTATFLEDSDVAKATRIPSLIRYMDQIGLDYHQDGFLFSVVEMAVVSKLRDIKYRGRIPVEHGVTLYGIMDETGYLKEGEVFIVTQRTADDRTVRIFDKVVVTRSPALHPGDIQLAGAVNVPSSSPLQALSNVVVFSQHGERDLPSQLAGGDLDGDLYNIIWDPQLIPGTTFQAADYPRVEAPALDRNVTRQDMSDFFVNFMRSDLLGVIANRHLILADQNESGVHDDDCMQLAELHSTAVDFSKTGIPVDMKALPGKFEKTRYKPDFMAPNPRVVVGERGFVDFEEEDEEDDNAFEGIDSERSMARYYPSQKALGHLYRAIDERAFVQRMQREHHLRVGQAQGRQPDKVLSKILQYAKTMASRWGVLYDHHRTLASDIRDTYEWAMVSLLHDYEPSPHSPLSEAEVFSGQILGRQGGLQGKALREQCQTMRARLETVIDHIVVRITKGDAAIAEAEDVDDLINIEDEHYHEREVEGLPRAIACLEAAVTESGYNDRKLGELQSFKYIAAAVCLRELDRFQMTTWDILSGLRPA